MGNDGHLPAHLGHDVLQRQLPLLYALIDTLPGGATHIQALDSLVQQMLCQSADSLGADLSLPVIASIERGENPLIFCKIFHSLLLTF